MDLLRRPWFTATNLSHGFPIFETSATALCGTTGIILQYVSIVDATNCRALGNAHVGSRKTRSLAICPYWSLLVHSGPPSSNAFLKHSLFSVKQFLNQGRFPSTAIPSASAAPKEIKFPAAASAMDCNRYLLCEARWHSSHSYSAHYSVSTLSS